VPLRSEEEPGVGTGKSTGEVVNGLERPKRNKMQVRGGGVCGRKVEGKWGGGGGGGGKERADFVLGRGPLLKRYVENKLSKKLERPRVKARGIGTYTLFTRRAGNGAALKDEAFQATKKKQTKSLFGYLKAVKTTLKTEWT